MVSLLMEDTCKVTVTVTYVNETTNQAPTGVTPTIRLDSRVGELDGVELTDGNSDPIASG